MSKLYGYWVSRDEVYEVEYCSHYDTALEIIETLYGTDGRARVENSSEASVYRYMFHLGFIRVVNDINDDDNDEYSVQYRKGTKLSKLQKEFIKDATYCDVSNDPKSWGVAYI